MFQKPGESITDYFHRIDLCQSKIIEKLNAEIKDGTLPGRMATTEETALSVFVNGICNEIGTMLRTRGFRNLSEAGRFAMEEDKIRAMNIARQSLFKASNYSRPTIIQRNQNTTNFRANYNNVPPVSVKSPSNTKICSYCKNPGHLISECRKRAYNNNLRYNQSNSHIQRPMPSTQTHQPIPRALPAPPARVNNLNSEATNEMSNSLEIASTSCSTTQTPTSAINLESIQLEW